MKSEMSVRYRYVLYFTLRDAGKVTLDSVLKYFNLCHEFNRKESSLYTGQSGKMI